MNLHPPAGIGRTFCNNFYIFLIVPRDIIMMQPSPPPFYHSLSSSAANIQGRG